ncbi:MAG: SPASM domain-containing protein [Bdellovibrionia bacterium]
MSLGTELKAAKETKDPALEEVFQKRRPCKMPFTSIMVRPDSSVTMCAMDTVSTLSMGSLNEKSLDELWCSDDMMRWRVAEIRKDFNKIPKFCQTCTANFPLDGPQVLAFLKSVGLEHLWPEYERKIEQWQTSR